MPMIRRCPAPNSVAIIERYVHGAAAVILSNALSRKLQQAEQSLRSGDAPTAQALCEQILRKAPRNPDALFLHAMARLALGAPADAVPQFERLLAVDARHGAALEHLGLALLMLGRHAEAEQALRRASRVAGAPASVFMRLGLAVLEQGRADEAIELLRRAAQLDATDADTQLNLGRALATHGDDAGAEHAFARALELAPQRAEPAFNLGLLAVQRGELARAQQWFERSLAADPYNAAALSESARTLALLGRLEASRERWLATLAVAPDSALAHESLGRVALALGRTPEAVEHLRGCARIEPDNAPARAALATALFEAGALDEAASEAKTAIALDPDAADAYTTAANVHLVREELDECIAVLEAGYERTHAPALLGMLTYQLRQACDWKRWRAAWDALAPLVDTSDSLSSPFWLLCEPTTPEQQLRYASRWAAQRFRGLAQTSAAARTATLRADAMRADRIRIGYLSSDFHEHATAYLVAEVLEAHDRDRFEIRAYSYGPEDGSPMRARLRAACEHFIDIAREPDDVAARRIESDALDILVDLKGYTVGDRLGIMARRPCPIQVTWLGYPGTTGADFIDYAIADAIVVPSDAERHYSERILRMPHCYQPNDRKRAAAEPLPREAYGLPAGAFVFCCFNQTYKITPEIFECWMRLLRDVPGSVLWLLASNPLAAGNLRGHAQAHGIDADRIVLAPRLPNAAHLARYKVADLALDTFPYTSHTTLSDALWCGCPAIALCGETFAARVSTSILAAAGMPDLVAQSLSQYEALARALALDPQRLADARARVARSREDSPLFASTSFARALEAIYAELVERHRREL